MPGNDVATADSITSTPQADLAVTKVGPATVVPGDSLSYVVSVTNNGPSTAAGVVLTDTLGAGLSGATAPGCSGSPLACPVGPLAAGDSTSFTVTATADRRWPAVPP